MAGFGGNSMNTQLPSHFLSAMSKMPKRHELHSTQEFEIRDFPTAVLPPILENMVKEVARITQTPESMAGCLSLGIVGASIGKGLKLRGHANRPTGGNLYILISADSGTGKTVCAKEIFKPFIEFDQYLLDEWINEELPGLETSEIQLKEEISSALREWRQMEPGLEKEQALVGIAQTKKELNGIKAQINHPPRLYVENVTSERLAHLLSNQPNECLASLSSDAADCIEILAGRYQKKETTDEGIYLKGFSGDPCRVDRVNGRAVNLKSPHLTVCWLTQPDKLQQLFSVRRFTDGGFMPRFLAFHTGCQPQERLKNIEAIPSGVELEYEKLIKSLAERFLSSDTTDITSLSKEAQETYRNYYNEVVRKRRQGGELSDVNSYAARWEENALRLGLVLHAAEHGKTAASKTITNQTAERSIELIDWFSEQQLLLLETNREDEVQAKEEKVIKLIESNYPKIKATDLARKRITPNAAAARLLLSQMVDKGILEKEEVPPAEGKGGHTQTLYQLKT
jgi:hypothetical protein